MGLLLGENKEGVSQLIEAQSTDNEEQRRRREQKRGGKKVRGKSAGSVTGRLAKKVNQEAVTFIVLDVAAALLSTPTTSAINFCFLGYFLVSGACFVCICEIETIY